MPAIRIVSKPWVVCNAEPEACALWGFRQACLSRTLLGPASWERGRPARKWDGEAAADQCGRDARVPRTPVPRKQLRGVKSDEEPLRTDPKPWNNAVPVG